MTRPLAALIILLVVAFFAEIVGVPFLMHVSLANCDLSDPMHLRDVEGAADRCTVACKFNGSTVSAFHPYDAASVSYAIDRCGVVAPVKPDPPTVMGPCVITGGSGNINRC